MTTETTEAPGAISPGRAACEAFWAAVEAGPSIQEPGAAWNWAISQKATRAWEAAAKAASTAAERERDGLRSLVAEILDMAEGTLNGETFIRRGEIAQWRKQAGIAS